MKLEIEIKVENKEDIQNLEQILQKFCWDSHSIKCKGANLDKSPVPALIIYKKLETEIRCPRYKKETKECGEKGKQLFFPFYKIEKETLICTYADK